MPNNVSILSYIQCMKDNQNAKIKLMRHFNQEKDVLKLEIFLGELFSLEKFIKGGK